MASGGLTWRLFDGGFVGQAVATALNLREDTDCSPADRVAQAIDTRELLLIIDNCEHVVEVCRASAGTPWQRSLGSRDCSARLSPNCHHGTRNVARPAGFAHVPGERSESGRDGKLARRDHVRGTWRARQDSNLRPLAPEDPERRQPGAAWSRCP
jgi:hypothetical protein